MVKPDLTATQSVPLRFGNNKSSGKTATTSAAGTGAVSLNLNGKRKNWPLKSMSPAGVGYVDFSDDFETPEVDDEDDNDLIDEDTLLDEEDLKRPAVQRKSLIPVYLGGVSFH